MSYPDDNHDTDLPGGLLSNEDVLRVLIMIISILMIIIGLPSLVSHIYDDPLPGIVLLGFTAVILSILYLASKIDNLVLIWE